MKKGLSLFLSLLITLSLCLSAPFALKSNAATVDSLTFKLNDDGKSYYVSDCSTSASGALVIPSTYNGLPVTSIGNDAFYNCCYLTSVTIGKGVTSIGFFAFKNCTSLTSITIPDSVTSIGTSAFYNTAYYNNSSNWENDVLYIGNHLIETKTSLSGDYVIKDGTKCIGDEAFYYCTSLTSVTIPDSVTSIGSYAFYYCTSLTSVTIGSGVTSVGITAFSDCSNLNAVYISDLVSWCNIDFANTSANPLYCAKNLYLNGSKVTDLVIPQGVTEIKNYAFYGCNSLTSVTIGSGVTSIGYAAFDGCSKLTAVNITDVSSWCNIDFYNSNSNPLYYAKKLYLNGEQVTDLVIPEGITEIKDYAFRGCTSLTSVTIGNSVTSIGYDAFYKCTSLTSVTIGNSVTSIGYDAFYKCASLTSITIPDSVTSIGEAAFYSCSKLTSITIPDSVTSIGENAFSGCNNLKYKVYPDTYGYSYVVSNNLTNVLVLGTMSAADLKFCLNADGETYSCDGFINFEFENIVIPSTYNGKPVTAISASAFENCTSIMSITIPDSVTSIGENAFYNTGYYNNNSNWENNVLYIGSHLIKAKTSLSGDYVIKESTKNIVGGAFNNCTKLTSVTIPQSVTNIGSSAFYGCSNISKVNITDVTSWVNISFGNSTANPLYYAKTLYLNGVLLTNLVIPNTTKTIGDFAFYNCMSFASVTIPESVTSIGEETFSGCNNFKCFVQQNSYAYSYVQSKGFKDVVVIGSNLIENLKFTLSSDGKSYICEGVVAGNVFTDLVVPSTYEGKPVTAISASAFENCTFITSVTLPDSITNIGQNAFYNTYFYNDIENWVNGVLYIGDYLVSAKPTVSGSLTIKSGTKVIADNVFENCADLRLLSVPASVKTIGDSAFKNCTTLKAVMFANGLKTIGAESFMNCTELSSITVPTSVTEIGEKAFYNTGFYNNSENWYNGVFYINEFLIEANKDISGVYEIKDGTKVILGNAFSNCTGLTAIKIPASVEKIGAGAFSNCTGLTAVYAKDIVSWCNIDFSSDFNSNPISYAGNLYLNDSLVTSLEIPSGVTNIKDYAFYGLKSINSLVVPNTVKSIGKNSFKNCSSLSTVKIAGSVEKIDDFAFADCMNLSNLKLNNGVKEIGNSTFINCSALKVVTFSNTLQKIGDSAFKNCSALSGVSFPQSLQSIGDYAFSNCTTLQVLSLNEGLTHLGKGAFYECTGLKNVKIPSTLKVISENAFYNCMYIGQLDISKGVETIGDYAFANCASIKKLQFPEGLKSIGNYSFWCCEMLYSVKFAEGLVSIGEMAFCECTFIKKLEFPESLENIGAEAFAESIQIQTIKFGNSLKSIGDYAFAELYDLKYVFYNNSETEWKNVSIGLGNECLSSAVIHYNSTNHSHSYESLYPVAGQNGLRIDVCPVCSLVLAEETLVYLNDDVAGVAECSVSISEKSKIIYAEVSLCQSPDQFITVREGCQISATPSNSAGFYGTGSIIKILDEKGNLINSYELSVKGDVNGDGFCDALDCMLVELARHKNNNVSLSGAYLMGADFTSEGALTIEDFQAIISYALSVDRCITHEFMEATCTTGPQCVHCGKVSGKPLGHTVEVNPGTPATCYTTGLSDGTYCSSCGETLTQQQVTPKTTHSYDSTGNCINCDDHTADRLKEYVVAKGRKTGSSYVIETQDSDSGFYFRIDYNATSDKLVYVFSHPDGLYFEMTHSDGNTQKVALSVTFDDGTKMYCWADVNRSTFDNTNRSVSNCTYSSNVSTSTLKSQLKTLAGTQTAAVLSNLELVLLYFFIDIDPSSDYKYLDIESLGFTNFIIQ